MSIPGRGFDVSVAVPFGAPLSDGLCHAARRCAEACPTGAIALRSTRNLRSRRLRRVSGRDEVGGSTAGATDSGTFTAVTTLMLGVACLVYLDSARHAAGVHPASALSEESLLRPRVGFHRGKG